MDSPSDKPPAGGRGHLIVLKRKAVENALETLLGMGLDYCPGWDGHDARRKIGVITTATLDGDQIRVSGHVYANDFKDILPAIHAQDMGMSYELIDARIEDMRMDVWSVTQLTFTGAAVLLREKAACRATDFVLEQND